jgi:hypothetical protein
VAFGNEIGQICVDLAKLIKPAPTPLALAS